MGILLYFSMFDNQLIFIFIPTNSPESYNLMGVPYIPRSLWIPIFAGRCPVQEKNIMHPITETPRRRIFCLALS
jgi:hypothetical protein